MRTSLPRRSLLATGAVSAALGATALLPAAAHADPARAPGREARVDLLAEVLDLAEQRRLAA